MDHRLPRLTLCALLALLGLPLASPGQEDAGYKPVEVQYLADNLPKFWATGLAFLDTVIKPVTQVKQKVGNKTYLQFETKTLGPCYVDAALGERLSSIAPGRDLVFTATVLHKNRGFFSFGGSPQYFVAVINLQPALGSVSGLPEQMSGFAVATNSPDARVLANVDELLKGLQTEVAVLARERSIPAWELMAPGSTNRTDVELLVTRGVNALADAMAVEPHDVLGQMLMAIMTARVQPDQPALVAPKPAVVAPPTEPSPPAEPADVVVTKPAREPETAPDTKAASGVVDTAVEMAGANAPVTVAPPAPTAAITKDEQARLARAKADEEKRARAEAEQAAEAKAAQEKLAKAEQKRLAREKAAQEEAAREAAEKAAEEKAAQDKKARAEQQRLERERLAAEKKAAEEKARAAKAQAEQEAEARAAQAKADKKRLAAEQEAREEAARNAAKAAAEAPKMRASTTVDAATGTVLAEPKSAQPSAKIQPKPAETPAPTPAPPAAGADDPNAPVPL